jgi:acyl-CoA synthetase (NDP forming)
VTHAARTRLLDPMLRAESVVVIGASDDPEKVGGRALLFLLTHQYAGAISLVNPKRTEIRGLPVVPSIRDIPQDVDLALICLPAPACPDALDQCGQRGVRAAVVFSGGFSETGEAGRILEDRLVAAARKWDIALCGPNTVGFVNLGHNLPATFAAPLADLPATHDGSVSFIAQSGAFGTFLYSWAMERRLPLRHFVSIGNSALLGTSDFAADLIEDDEVRALGIHLEGIRDGRRLLPALRHALEAAKPVCILKTGRTEIGQRAVATHTGALAGSQEVYSGVFDQTGVVRVADPLQMLDFLDLSNQVDRLPAGSRVGLISTSGGVGVWASDILDEMGATLPEFSDETRGRLSESLPGYGSSHNPIDMTGQILASPEMVGECLAAVLDDPGIDVALLIFGYQVLNGPRIAADIVAAATASPKPTVVVWMFAGDEPYRSLQEAAIPVFDEPSRTVPALGRYLKWCTAYRAGRDAKASPAIPARPGISLIDRPDHVDPSGVMSEAAAKTLLSGLGIAGPAGGLAASAAQAGRIAAAVGYPVVLKGLLPGIPHKSSHGLVVLGIRSQAQLRREFRALRAQMARIAADGRAAPVLVEAFTPGECEFILGYRMDPSFGKVILFGSGGTMAESTRDICVRALPLSDNDVHALIAGTHVGSVLLSQGGDARPAALKAVIRSFERAVEATAGWADSIEINPLVFRSGRAEMAALDALIVAKGASLAPGAPDTDLRPGSQS